MVGLTDDLPNLLDTGLDRPSLSLLSCLGRDLESPAETAQRRTWSFCSQNKPSKYDWINQNCLPGMNNVLIDLRQIQTFPIMHWGLSPQSELKTVSLSTVSCDVSIKTFTDSQSVFYSQRKFLKVFLKINRLTDIPAGQLRTDNKYLNEHQTSWWDRLSDIKESDSEMWLVDLTGPTEPEKTSSGDKGDQLGIVYWIINNKWKSEMF